MANAVSVPNPVKEPLKSGKVALGMLVRLARSGDIAFMMTEASRVTGELRKALDSGE